MMIFVACLVIFVYGMLSSLLGTIIPGLADELRLSNSAIGYIALAQGAGLAGSSVFAGALIDRRGTKLGVITGLGTTLTGLILLVESSNLLSITLAMFVLGCGGSIVIVAANAIASEVGDKRRAAALNFLNVFSGLGGVATPFIAGNLLGASPSKTGMAGFAATALVLLVALLTPMSGAKQHSGEGSRIKAGIFSSPSLYLLSTVTLLYTACEFGIWNWLPKYLTATGMARANALTILSLGFACGLLTGRIAAMPILLRFSPLTITVASSLAMVVTTYWVVHPMSRGLTAILVFITGLSMAPVFPTTVAIIGKLFRAQSATAIGFAITCGFSGLMLSSPVIGWLSGPGAQGIGHGLRLLPICSLTICIILIFSRNIFRHEEEKGVAIGALAESSTSAQSMSPVSSGT